MGLSQRFALRSTGSHVLQIADREMIAVHARLIRTTIEGDC